MMAEQLSFKYVVEECLSEDPKEAGSDDEEANLDGDEMNKRFWADEQFPICAGHGQPCTIRTVMKIWPNDVRSFFTRKLHKNTQCKGRGL
ncbi:hypothetical protein DPMN_107298 [Dreissena polymorpha]|uniref:Uncharacterized protein n=1 Tax=Dreissena polymorpha TaxID=45954 RepID=A0A9D4K6N9_DREPO|nr:hypothetical protein DPMN_107298 [Dreissena polymorpha]